MCSSAMLVTVLYSDGLACINAKFNIVGGFQCLDCTVMQSQHVLRWQATRPLWTTRFLNINFCSACCCMYPNPFLSIPGITGTTVQRTAGQPDSNSTRQPAAAAPRNATPQAAGSCPTSYQALLESLSVSNALAPSSSAGFGHQQLQQQLPLQLQSAVHGSSHSNVGGSSVGQIPGAALVEKKHKRTCL